MIFSCTLVKLCFYSYIGSDGLILQPDAVTSYANVRSSIVLQSLVFCGHTSALYGHCNVTLHSMPETQEHRQIRMRSVTKRHVPSITSVSPRRGPGSSPPPPSSTGLPVSPTRVPLAAVVLFHSLSVYVNGDLRCRDPEKTWQDCVNDHMKSFCLSHLNAYDNND